MYKPTYKIDNGPRVQHLTRGAAPGTKTPLRTKDFSLTVKCAADFATRIPKLENLQLELLNKKLHSKIKPESLVSGRFKVTEGFEATLKEIAAEHGFNATEMIEV